VFDSSDNMQHMQQYYLTAVLFSSILVYMKSYLNASEIAKLLKVDRATVTRWAQKGKLKGSIRVAKSHQWRIPIAAFEKLVNTIK